MTAWEIIASVLMISGSVLAVIAAIGINRFPDVFSRMHAATKPATLGLALVALGAICVVPVDAKVRLTLVVLFQFVSAPLGAHMIGRSAYRSGDELAPNTSPDELAPLENHLASDPDEETRDAG